MISLETGKLRLERFCELSSDNSFVRRDGHFGAPSTCILPSFLTLASLIVFAMVKNRRSILVRKIIKEELSERPYIASDLVIKVKKRLKNQSKSSQEISAICNTDPEIQIMYPNVRDSSRWGLRTTILERWNDNKYFLERETDYLTSRALSDNLNPNRKSEFEFFRSLRDIINEEE
jgi:hypothetical protein